MKRTLRCARSERARGRAVKLRRSNQTGIAGVSPAFRTDGSIQDWRAHIYIARGMAWVFERNAKIADAQLYRAHAAQDARLGLWHDDLAVRRLLLLACQEFQLFHQDLDCSADLY